MPWHTDKTAIYEDCAPKKAAFHVKLEVIQYKIKIQKKPFFLISSYFNWGCKTAEVFKIIQLNFSN